MTAEMETRVAVSVSEVAQIQKKIQDMARGSRDVETLKKFKSLAEELRESGKADEGSEADGEGENPQRENSSEMSTESECDIENSTDDTRNDHFMFTEGPEEIVSEVLQYQGEQNPTSWIKTWQGPGETRDEADVPVVHLPGNGMTSTAPSSCKDRKVETPKKGEENGKRRGEDDTEVLLQKKRHSVVRGRSRVSRKHTPN